MKLLKMTVLLIGSLIMSSHMHAQPTNAQTDETTTQALTNEDAEVETVPFKVMSFNILWGNSAAPPMAEWPNRHDFVLSTIQAFDPDILGVQESLLKQSKFLRDKMKGFIFFGAGRDNGKLGGEMCAVFYRGSRFRRVGGGHFWLSDEPDTPGDRGWDAAFPRMVTWLRLRDRTDGRTFVFANTHFDHRGKKARLNSAILMREEMKKIAEGDPVVILGDFNCDEESEPYAELLGKKEGEMPWLVDAYRAVHPKKSEQEASYHGFQGTTEGSRIDWVLHTPDLQALTAEIDRTHDGLKYPSDHYPVTATLKRIDSPD